MGLGVRDQSLRPGFISITAAVFGLLALSGLLELLIGWTHTSDVRAWWPFLVALDLVIVLVYAALFAAAMRVARIRSFLFMVIYNVILGAMLLIHTTLFYTIKVDRLGVNDGSVQLTILERVVFSQVTHVAIFLAFLAGAWIIASTARLKARH